MEQLSISYFRDLWSQNVNDLENLCKEWETKQTDLSVPEEVRDEIRTTIGLTNLLLCQKLKQFHGLIDDSEFKTGEKEINCLDLQGFWEMVYNEVEKIQKRFLALEKCQKNGWVFVQEEALKVETKKKMFPTLVKVSVSSKKHASAARQRLAEVKLKMKAQMAKQKENTLAKEVQDDNSTKLLVSKEGPMKRDDRSTEASSEHKSSISNIKDTKNSQHSTKVSTAAKKNPPSKTKSRNKIGNLDKENVLSSLVLEPETNVRKGRGKAKEVLPLQCVTRSAKKAMLMKQNGLHEN